MTAFGLTSARRWIRRAAAAGTGGNALWLFGAQVAALVVTFVATPVELHQMGAERYGIVVVLAALTGYLGDRWGFDRDWQFFDGSMGPRSAHRPVARAIVSRALRWLEQRKKPERPFFIWLHIFDPHWDYSPPSPFDTIFDPATPGG